MSRIIIYDESEWFIDYVMYELGSIYNSYITEATEGLGAVKILSSEVQEINVGMKDSLLPYFCYICNVSKNKILSI